MYKTVFILFLFGCTTTKYIDREKVVVDSSVVEQNETLQKTLHETIEKHQQEKEQWENTGVTFYRDTVTKIVFEKGKVKYIEGPVKALNQSKYEKDFDLREARTTIDSMKSALAKKETKLLKQTVTIKKNIKTKFFPGWAYFLIPVIFLLGSIVESKFKYMQRIFSLLKI